MNVKHDSKHKTILIVLPYGIGWKSIINDDVLKLLSNVGLRIVILAEDNMINSSDPNIIVKPLIKYQRSRFEIAFGLIRNYIFADVDKKHSETLKLKIIWHKRADSNPGNKWLRGKIIDICKNI